MNRKSLDEHNRKWHNAQNLHRTIKKDWYVSDAEWEILSYSYEVVIQYESLPDDNGYSHRRITENHERPRFLNFKIEPKQKYKITAEAVLECQ